MTEGMVSIARSRSIISEGDSRWGKWNLRWKNKPNFSRYDSVELTKESLDEMSEMVFEFDNVNHKTLDLVDNPALPEFTLRILSLYPNEMSICFKRTILPTNKRQSYCYDGSARIAKPRIDAYISSDGGKTVDWVVNIGGSIGENDNQLYNWPVWAKDKNREFFPVMNHVNTIYALIQKALYDRPTVFTQSLAPASIDENTHRGGNNRRKTNRKRKVKMIRIIRLLPEAFHDFCEEIKTHHEISCPCWGVIGHWRQLKSGKRVWIRPHTKGKQRNDPEVYSTKEYIPVDK